MKSPVSRIFIVLFAALSLSACRSAPVYDVYKAPMGAPADVTLEDVTAAIKRAGTGLGWQMTEQGNGKIEGKLSLRSHVAVVDIYFDTKKFSIIHRYSEKLNYDGTNIHKNYNGWIQNLERAILAQTVSL